MGRHVNRLNYQILYDFTKKVQYKSIAAALMVHSL